MNAHPDAAQGLSDGDIPTLGHNQPPEPTLIERAEQLVERANQRINDDILDEDTAGRAQGFYDQLRTARDELEAAKRKEREPFLLELDMITTRYSSPAGKIRLAYDLIGQKLTAWTKLKQRRLDADKVRQQLEAERLLEEAREMRERAAQSGDPIGATVEADEKVREAAEALQDANKPVERARTRGDYSARALGLRTLWDARLKGDNEGALAASATALLRAYARDPEARPAMIHACLLVAKKRAKAVKRADLAPPGVEFFSEQKV